jgi:PKD repeat protein
MAVGSFRLPSGGASLIVDFSVNDATPDTNQTITFTDLTVGATSWVWNFGDGTTSSLQNPTHSYKLEGTYTITLAADNGSSGGIETKVGFITVSLQPLITTNLQANYDANNYDESTGTQLDSTVNAFNLTQGTLSDRPTKTVGGLNGRDFITFDGINDVLSNTSVLFTRATGHTVISVIKRLRAGSPSAEYFHRSNSTPIGGVTPSFIAGNTSTTNTYTLFAGTLLSVSNTPPLSEWAIVVEIYDASNTSIRINNNPKLTFGTIGTTAATGLQESTTSAQKSNYSRSQRLVYTDVKSDADVNSIVQHLQAKYNLY